LIKNISNDPRSWGPDNGGPTAFLMVHVVLAVVSIGFGSAIGWLGWRGLRASRQQTPEIEPAAAADREPLEAVEAVDAGRP
jgi:hypothetical protein